MDEVSNATGVPANRQNDPYRGMELETGYGQGVAEGRFWGEMVAIRGESRADCKRFRQEGARNEFLRCN
jgi:hypothetical protein